jgi:hypothetical protein
VGIRQKAADVCDHYLDPPQNAVDGSVDEKSSMQARSRIDPTKPALPSEPVQGVRVQAQRGGPTTADTYRSGTSTWVTRESTNLLE